MYEAFYHLTAKPFRLSPDPRLYFGSAGHKRAWSYLLYGLNQQEGFVVLTGQPGTGKTLLVQKLLYEINNEKLNVVHLTSTQLNADDLVCVIAAKLRLAHENVSKSILLQNIEAYLVSQYHRQIRCLIIVDEAQSLPAESLEELRMFSNFQFNNNALLQIFLLGQNQLKTLLASPTMEQLQQRVIANYQLSPLKPEETKQYIESRLSCVGWQNDPQFTKDACQLIYEITDGIPRRINHFCDRILLFSYLEEEHEITSAIVEAVQNELLEENSGNSIDTDSLSDSSENEQKNSNNVLAMGPSLPLDKQTTSLDEEIDREKIHNSNHSGQTARLTVAPKDADYRESEGPSYTSKNDTISNVSNDLPAQDQKQKSPSSGDTQDVRTLFGESTESHKESKFLFDTLLNKQFEILSRKLAKLVLTFYSKPHKYKRLQEPLSPLPENLGIIFQWLLVDEASLLEVLPKSLTVSPIEIKKASLYFIQQVIFQKDANYYRTLGLTFGVSSEIIQKHYQLLMRLFDSNKFIESLRYVDADLIQKIQTAYIVLSDNKTREDYDNRLKKEKQSWFSLLIAEAKAQYEYFVTRYLGWQVRKQGPEGDARSDAESVQGNRNEAKIAINESLALGNTEIIIQRMDVKVNSKVSQWGWFPKDQMGRRQILLGLAAISFILIAAINLILQFYPKDTVILSNAVADNLNSKETTNLDSLIHRKLSKENGLVKNVGDKKHNADELRDSQVSNSKSIPRVIEIIEPSAKNTLKSKGTVKTKTNKNVIKKTLEKTSGNTQEKLESTTHTIEYTSIMKSKPVQSNYLLTRVVTKISLPDNKMTNSLELDKARKAAEFPERTQQIDQQKKTRHIKNITKYRVTEHKMVAVTPIQKYSFSTFIPSDIRNFISTFSNAYEKGALDDIMVLFGNDAYSASNSEKKVIQKNYQDLFNQTKSRKIRLDRLHWQLHGQTAKGGGQFEVKYLYKKDARQIVKTGDISFKLVKDTKNKILITNLNHTFNQ